MLIFDADVNKTTARHQCVNRLTHHISSMNPALASDRLVVDPLIHTPVDPSTYHSDQPTHGVQVRSTDQGYIA